MMSLPNLRVRRRLALVPVAVGLSVVFTAGCGSGSVGFSEGKGDQAHGKELFIASCGGCHTLANAGTKGQIGPNLDYAFLQSREDGLGESTFVQVVRGQIAYPVVKPSTGAPGMPADILDGQDADDVASYVGHVAGDKDLMAAAPTQPATTTPPPAAGGGGTVDMAAGKTVFGTAG